MSHFSNKDGVVIVFLAHVMPHNGFDLTVAFVTANPFSSLRFSMDTPLVVPPPGTRRYLERECADYKR